MVSDMVLYTPKYCKLSNKIIDKIEFYIIKGKIRSKQIFSLLVLSFSDAIIHKRDLYNAI